MLIKCVCVLIMKISERHMDCADVFERERTIFHLLNFLDIAGNMIKSLELTTVFRVGSLECL